MYYISVNQSSDALSHSLPKAHGHRISKHPAGDSIPNLCSSLYTSCLRERERESLIPYRSIGVKRIHFLTRWTRDPCSLKLVTIHTKVERSLGGQWSDPEREEEGTCYCLFRS